MHIGCIGGLGNTSSLPIVMINVVFENTPFWALGVYGRILRAPIPQYTAVYSGVYSRILRVYSRILGVLVCTTWLFQVEKFHRTGPPDLLISDFCVLWFSVSFLCFSIVALMVHAVPVLALRTFQ